MIGRDDHDRRAVSHRDGTPTSDDAGGEVDPIAALLSPEPERSVDAIAEAERRHAANGLPAAPGRAWRDVVATVLAVSAGGSLGAVGRYVIGRWASERWGEGFPWGTLLENVAGSFVLGFYLTLVIERFVGSPTTRLFLATGVLGSFTTFSTFSYEAVQVARDGEVIAAIAYVAVSLLLGLAAGIAGIVSAHAL